MTSCNFCQANPKDQLKRCVCGKVFYCSKECQAKDWKTHKPSCPPFVIRESPGKGRGLFATRKIKEGQIILDEYPLFIFWQGMSFFEFGTSHYPNIDEETKEKILKLYCSDPTPCVEVIKIFRILCSNGSKVCGDGSVYSNTTELALYDNIALLNHSCVPNASCSWVNGDFKRHQVRAIMTIEKEEEILIGYENKFEFVYSSREDRRQHLLKTGGFLCSCSECSKEGEDLEDNERMRREADEKSDEIEQLLGGAGSLSRKSMKKILKLAQQRVNLTKELNLRTGFVGTMVLFYKMALLAETMNISCANDPEIYKQEALKYAKMFGDNYIYQYNRQLLCGY